MKTIKLQEDKFLLEEEKNNSCAICYNPMFDEGGEDNGEAYLLESCVCVMHKDCIAAHIDASLKKGTFEFRCPRSECRKILPDSDLEQLLTPEMFALKGKMSVNAVISSHGDIKRCMTPNCEYAVVMEEGQYKLTCELCKKVYCLDCKVEFHEGISCNDWKLK